MFYFAFSCKAHRGVEEHCTVSEVLPFFFFLTWVHDFFSWRVVWLHKALCVIAFFSSLAVVWREWGLLVRREIGGLDQESLALLVMCGLVSLKVPGKFLLLHVAVGKRRSSLCPP